MLNSPIYCVLWYMYTVECMYLLSNVQRYIEKLKKGGVQMNKSKLKAFKVMTTAALTSLMLSSLTAFAETNNTSPQSQPVVYEVNQSKVDQVLKQLTPKQRRAIQELTQTTTSGIQLAPKTDLSSEQEISVIIEFKNKPAKSAVLIEKLNGRELTQEDAEKLVEEDHSGFQHDLDALKIKGKITTSYKQVYNGVALTLSANEVKNLLKSKAVKNVWDNQVVQIDLPSESAEQGTAGTTAYTGSAPHDLMGVDKLHKEGITGKGIKIGVLDTGIDYNHPALKDAFKVGYDFVDDDNDPMETTYEDWLKSGKTENTGRPYSTDHGTHVSGIIAGQQKDNAKFATKGVAPDADLYVYRVLGPYSTGSEENIIEGIEESVKDKMDVINLSLGNSYNSPLSPPSVTINNAVLSGITAVLSYTVWGDQSPQYMSEWMVLSNSSVWPTKNLNKNTPTEVDYFAQNRSDWTINVKDANGNIVDTFEVKNEKEVHRKWVPNLELANGNYFISADIVTKDGFKVTTTPVKVTVLQ
jgi:hypothetical protein